MNHNESQILTQIINSRRSIRKFKSDKPSRAQIEALIAAAIAAPSASNKQPWRFFVSDNQAQIEAMAQTVAQAVMRIAQHVVGGFNELFRIYGDYFVRFCAAPVVIVPAFREITILSNLVDKEIAPTDLAQIRTMEFNSGVVSASLAIENLLLFAHASGLGASCMTGPLVAANELGSILKIPASWHIAALIAVGFPDEQPTPSNRKNINTVLRWLDQSAAESAED